MDGNLGITTPPKVKTFLWKLKWNVLSTRVFLNIRNIAHHTICLRCNLENETNNHFFLTCPRAVEAWTFIGKWWSEHCLRINVFVLPLDRLLNFMAGSITKSVWKIIVGATLWNLWLARNETAFSKTNQSSTALNFIIMHRVSKWEKASSVMCFGNDPLVQTNLKGALRVYFSKLSLYYWCFQQQSYDLVCVVDGV